MWSSSRNRKTLHELLRNHPGNLLRELVRYKKCEIGEGHLMIDHQVHMLLSIPPKDSGS